jgi:hypothetical protein
MPSTVEKCHCGRLWHCGNGTTVPSRSLLTRSHSDSIDPAPAQRMQASLDVRGRANVIRAVRATAGCRRRTCWAEFVGARRGPCVGGLRWMGDVAGSERKSVSFESGRAVRQAHDLRPFDKLTIYGRSTSSRSAALRQAHDLRPFDSLRLALGTIRLATWAVCEHAPAMREPSSARRAEWCHERPERLRGGSRMGRAGFEPATKGL